MIHNFCSPLFKEPHSIHSWNGGQSCRITVKNNNYQLNDYIVIKYKGIINAYKIESILGVVKSKQVTLVCKLTHENKKPLSYVVARNLDFVNRKITRSIFGFASNVTNRQCRLFDNFMWDIDDIF